MQMTVCRDSKSSQKDHVDDLLSLDSVFLWRRIGMLEYLLDLPRWAKVGVACILLGFQLILLADGVMLIWGWAAGIILLIVAFFGPAVPKSGS